jgi:hypothetical protein
MAVFNFIRVQGGREGEQNNPTVYDLQYMYMRTYTHMHAHARAHANGSNRSPSPPNAWGSYDISP